MSTIQVTICGQLQQLAADTTAAQAIARFTPYGEEAVICRLNGQVIRSIDANPDLLMREGDVLEIYPLIIGG